VRNVGRLHRRWNSENQTAKNTRHAQEQNNWRQKHRFEVKHHDHRKNAQMQRKQKACRSVRHTRKGLRWLSGQTRKGCSEESRDDNADSTERGVPLRRYDPKLICARSWFEGVRKPRNEWNRRLRTKIALEQTSRTSTSKREEENQDITRVARTRRRGICSHHTHDAGERSKKKIGQTYNGFANWYINQSRKTKGGIVHWGRKRGYSSYK